MSNSHFIRKAFKVTTVVNRAFPFLHAEPLKTTLTVSLIINIVET